MNLNKFALVTGLLASGISFDSMFASATQAVTIGSGTDGNCLPFSCSPNLNVVRYQQVYSSSAFSGPLSFNNINFFLYQDGLVNPTNLTISFSTTSKAVNGLDSNPNNNVGVDNSVFGTFSESGLLSSNLSFTGNIFNYDPTQGNLLMDISNISGTNNGSNAFNQSGISGTVTSRTYQNIGSSVANVDSVGLITNFNNVATAVPEPFTIIGTLVGGTAALRMRKKLKASAD